eukprot:9106135-Karenia_brevis.AAC.1
MAMMMRYGMGGMCFHRVKKHESPAGCPGALPPLAVTKPHNAFGVARAGRRCGVPTRFHSAS